MVDEFRIVGALGETLWIRYMMRPVWDQHQTQIVRVYGAGQDITDERAVQAQQAQFITHAMHELSHPVSSILMRLYLMRKQPEKLDEHLDALHPVTEQIRRMIEDMREASYLDRHLVTLELRDLVLQDVMSNVVRDHAAGATDRSIHVDLELNPEPLTVHADDEQLTRALTHLVNNAIVMSPAFEAINIRVFPALPLYAVCEIEHRRQEVDDEHPSVAFHPFSRPSQGQVTHTGLELSIARSIIKLHGGDIALTTDEGHRSVFTVRLKLAAQEE
jgi:signal transduction histidine kinase